MIARQFGGLFLLYSGETADMNLEDLLTYLIEKGRSWVEAQRNHHRPSSRTLTESEKAAFRPFFGEGILNVARVKRVPIIENPSFCNELEAMGIPPPLDFTTMEGITFIDTVLISDSEHPQHEPLASLLFHELVHVVQYSWLGKDVFVERYIRGWADGGQNYFSIPLERDAYQLQERYEAQSYQSFSVVAEVIRRLGPAQKFSRQSKT